MRRIAPRSRLSRAISSLGVALVLVLAATAPGQAPSTTAAAPLARYVPGQDLVVYAEFDGLDAHADAWRKTAAYRLLNETTLGALLEDLAIRAIDQPPAPAVPGGAAPVPPSQGKLTGAEVLAISKHVARSGFVFAMVGDPQKPQPDGTILVLRKASSTREIRSLFGKFLGALYKPTSKPVATQVSDPRYAGQQSTIVTVTSPGVPLRTTLRLLLKPLGLGYSVKDGLLTITSAAGGPGDESDEVRGPRDARTEAIVAQLAQPISLPFKGQTPLEDVLKFLKDATRGPDGKGLPIYVDPAGLTQAAKTMQSPVTIDPQGDDWAWWAENGDLIFALGGGQASAAVIIETRSGRRPNAEAHPVRVELSKVDDGLLPVGLAFADLANLPPGAAKYGLEGTKRVDFRWGFQDDALMSIIRADAPSPRRGLLAPFDAPTFNKATLPPLPAGLTRFTVLSIEPAKVYDQLVVLAQASSPDAAARFDAAAKTIQDKSRLRLREDILGHLGPKLAFFLEPATPAPTGGSPNPLAALMQAMPQVPQFTLLVEIDNPSEFGKVLDELMLLANKEIKATIPRPGDGSAPPPPPEFKKASTAPLTYVMSHPSLNVLGVRPYVTVGKKYAVLSTSPKTAQQVLTLETAAEGRWSPTGDMAAVVDRLPANLTFLQLNDPRDAIAQTIANLPSLLPGGMPGDAAGNGPPPGEAAESSGGSGVPPPPDASRIDPARIPSAEALKSRLFPSSLAVAVDAQQIRIVSRGAFPDLAGLVNGLRTSLLLQRMVPPGPAAAGARTEDAGRATGGGGGISPGLPR